MRLYLDVDGVLADFTTGLMRALDIPYYYPEGSYPFKPGVWNWFPELEKRFGVGFEECDDMCDQNFWANLQWMHDGPAIVETVGEFFKWGEISLLTSPMPNTGSASGKMEWLEKNWPVMKKRAIITNVDKGQFAAPDRILIDDRDENIASWRAAGGIGITCPRPWNKARDCAHNAPRYIHSQLKEILG